MIRNSHDTNQASEDTRPTILRNLKNVEAREDDIVRLDVFVVGEPQPDVSFALFRKIYRKKNKKY
jgi:hypothetical protein